MKIRVVLHPTVTSPKPHEFEAELVTESRRMLVVKRAERPGQNIGIFYHAIQRWEPIS